MWPSWSKALDLGSNPQGREFKSRCQHNFFNIIFTTLKNIKYLYRSKFFLYNKSTIYIVLF